MSETIFHAVTQVGDDSIESHDSGTNLLLEVDSLDQPRLFARIHSSDESKEHPEMKSLIGKRVVISIEVVDE